MSVLTDLVYGGANAVAGWQRRDTPFWVWSL